MGNGVRKWCDHQAMALIALESFKGRSQYAFHSIDFHSYICECGRPAKLMLILLCYLLCYRVWLIDQYVMLWLPNWKNTYFNCCKVEQIVYLYILSVKKMLLTKIMPKIWLYFSHNVWKLQILIFIHWKEHAHKSHYSLNWAMYFRLITLS